MPSTPDALARQMAVLARLEGRAIAPASEFFAKQAEAGPPPPPAEQRRTSFAELYPHAEPLERDGARCWRVTSWAPLSGERTSQGYACPVLKFGVPPTPPQLALLTGDPAWAALDPARVLYLDTETTGLAGGSGTYTFLIGLGRFAPGPTGEPGFEVAQYFMEDYDGEAALVAACAEAFDAAQALVSYNGRSFDVPLLEARWRMQRRRPNFPALHLDLLHYARKLWKLRLPSCSLGQVESDILGIRRLSDVDGSWVPRIYFDFVQGIRPERLVPVFDHHAQDIISMGALVALLVRALEEPCHPLHAHASDQWGLARLWAARGEHTQSIACLEAAVLAARDEELGFRFAMHLARAYRRAGQVREAVAIWEARVPQARPGRLDPLIELAKHAEHTLRDYAAADAWVRRALALFGDRDALITALGGAAPLDSPTARTLATLNQRLLRLERRKAAPPKKAPRRRRGTA